MSDKDDGPLGLASNEGLGPPWAAKPPAAAWVCPWTICTPDQAKICRDLRNGCGGRFAAEMSHEQAKAKIEGKPEPVCVVRVPARWLRA